ncbi:MAG: hypothetical protein IJY04_08250 [Clostridia bacterium]|nr:hypothetical protein [Clostridia bacterium]
MSQKKKSTFKATREAFGKAMKSRPMEKVKFKWKRSLMLVGLGILAYLILRLLLEFEVPYAFVTWFVYEGIAGVSVIAYVITVRGNLSSTPTLESDLPREWSDMQKHEYLELEAERRKRGKKFLYIAVPFIFAVMMGMVSEIWWPMVQSGF